MVYVTASLIEPHGLFSYIFLSPLFWVLLAFVWVLTFGDSMRQPPIHKPYSKYVRPGDFVYDDEKEKTCARKRAGTPEHAIYAALERKRGLSGVKILREGTQIIIRKGEGKVGTEHVTPRSDCVPAWVWEAAGGRLLRQGHRPWVLSWKLHHDTGVAHLPRRGRYAACG